MGGSGSISLTIPKALEIAKANNEIPANVVQLLERSNTSIWQKIQAHPTTYIMTKDEYMVLNYFQERYKNNASYDQAVARFWKHFNGGNAQIDGSSSSRTPSKK